MSRRLGRRGVTIVELMVALVITATIGGALLRLVLQQGKFMDQQEAWRNARAVARSGVNVLTSELRMVEATGGLDAATAGGQDFTVRVSYAFGIVCSSTGSVTTVTILPVDSVMFAEPGVAGFAWRDATTGTYTYITTAPTITSPGTTANCTTNGISSVPASGTSPAGKVLDLSATVSPAPPAGSVLFLYRKIRYEFKASAAVSGRNGLWRTVSGQTAQELAAPFDTSARAEFFVLNGTASQTALPSPLSNARGLELRLNGSSEATPRGSNAPKNSNVVTAVYFTNRPD
jgi:hypothetical protein